MATITTIQETDKLSDSRAVINTNFSNLNEDKVETLSDLGITATKDEINILDGAIISTDELNYLDGVTSAIQTQLDGKASDSDVLKKDGSVALTANWDAGSYDIKAGSFTIGTNTLGSDEFGYLDGIDQALKTTDSPTFDDLTINTGLLQTTPESSADIKSLVNREYVDSAVTSLGASYYMTDDTDGDTGYKVCSLEPPDGNEAYIEDTITTEGAVSGAVWISKSGEEPAKLLRGIYGFFIEAEKTGGTKGVRLYWKMYELKSDDSTVLIETSTYSNLIENDRSSYIVPLKLNEDYELSAGSRVYGEFWAIPEGGGSDPTIKIYYQGDTSSRWDVPANSEVFKNIFVPYTGATQDVDLGSYGLTANDLTIGSLSGVLKASSGVVSGEATFLDLNDTPSSYSGTANKIIKVNSGASALEFVEDTASIVFVADGGGAEIEAGLQSWVRVPFACEIQSATLLADQTGSIQIDIWKDTYANYPPTDADSITASAPPSISSSNKSEDTTLSGWIKTINAGDVLVFNVDSASTIQRAVLILKVKKL